jgi:hypothetical protein
MKVVCLVPSLTETLIEAGVDVVGRTHFCIHPQDKVKNIPVIGGTKSADWSKLKGADLVVFDKEENTKEMAEACPFPYFAVHVTGLSSLVQALSDLSQKLSNARLSEWAIELKGYVETKPKKKNNLDNLPGILKQNRSLSKARRLRYLIWKNPFMEVGKNTFIADIFRCLGYEEFLVELSEKNYPVAEIDLDNENDDLAIVLSSEPYPFAKDWEKEWKEAKLSTCLVDGELYSWFGIRSLRFLRENLRD